MIGDIQCNMKVTRSRNSRWQRNRCNQEFDECDYRCLLQVQIQGPHKIDLGSKLETPITAPTMAPSTTPPATMLSKKFLREGEDPDPAASATSGITMEAVSAPAVNPVTNFSFNEALT
ncbi:hypothetical protein NC651_016228 [Populus alba x Populus x berolinensis]|nr:hypothetical protein NC651_016228 [Populus alba x Populus x berolinensis]